MVAVELYEDPRSDAARQLRKLRETNPKIDRQLRCMFARQIVGNVQKNYLRGQVLKRRSGDLGRAFRTATLAITKRWSEVTARYTLGFTNLAGR